MLENFLESLELAEQGNASAMLTVADCYYLGNGVERNLETAFHWYLQAANKGNGFAKVSQLESTEIAVVAGESQFSINY